MAKSEFTLLDGAMGTMLQAAGLPAGLAPEVWNVTRPAQITAVHRQYVEAGSRVLYANTFGANRLKIAGCGYTVSQLVSAGIRAARAADRGEGVRVALDIGPIGQLLEPLGSLSFAEAYDIFKEIVLAGRDAGADLIVLETMSDLAEARAALLAAKENSVLPVWTTMTFDASGRSFLGTTVSSMALTLAGLGADALGFNCSLGPGELLSLAEELRRWAELPLILKPNAGLPDPATGAYSLGPEAFAAALSQAAGLGVRILGGCCGTGPAYIRALAERLEECSPAPRPRADRRGLCSAVRTAELGRGPLVIGERINPTGKKRFQQALREGDMDAVLRQAVEQQEAGADLLDINVGLPGLDEAVLMDQVVRAVQSVCDLPLQIDSSNPAAVEAGLRACNGRALVNSVTGDEESLAALLPLCKKYGAAVVGLCLDKKGVPRTAAERLEIARRILAAALEQGIPRQDVFIDCLTLTVSAQPEQAAETLKALETVHRELGLGTVLGVSNISYGLPAREQVTASFLTQALYAGLDLPIANPNQKAVMDAIASYKLLSGRDPGAEAYIARFSGVESAPAKVAPEDQMSLAEAVARGLKAETAALTEQALEAMAPLEVINTLLIPALDRVGERYERRELFLPQLINAANAACEGFERVKERLAGRGLESVSKGKILLATVQGDVHDIGKNIVRVVLENYGYTVLDLGRDVAPETVVRTALQEKIGLVGLSALMTTTLPSMEKTIRALRQSGWTGKVMVGGAVLTEDYARQIGADYYAKDAKQSADIARLVLG